MRHLGRVTLIAAVLISLGGASFAADSEIKVDIKFDYKDTQLRMQLYEIQPEYLYSTARTALAKKISDVPVTKPMGNTVSFSEKHQAKTFALVVENKSAESKYFFATPHTFDPAQTSLGVLFECLCNHHVYRIPPKQIWYRIVRLKVDAKEINLKSTRRIQISHAVVEVPEKEALKNYRAMLYDQEPVGAGQ